MQTYEKINIYKLKQDVKYSHSLVTIQVKFSKNWYT